MRYLTFPFAAILAVASLLPAKAAEKPPTSKSNQVTRVWTNDDLDHLRARGLISIVGPDREVTRAQSAQAAVSPATQSQIAHYVRTQDPEWYAKRAAELQAALDERLADLRKAQNALARVPDAVTQPGVNLVEQNVGVTPQAGIARQEAQVREIESALDDLADLARRNSIPPGVVRG